MATISPEYDVATHKTLARFYGLKNMLDAAAQAKIAKLADHKVPEPSTSNDSAWNAISREAYVIGGGIADGFSANLNGKSLVQRTPDFLISMGVGAGLAAAQGKAGIVKLGAEIIGGAFMVGMVKDVAKPERIDGLKTAIGDTWNSSANLEHNRALVKQHAGDFAFDSTVMALGGSIGASGFRVSRSETAGRLKTMISEGLETSKTKLGGMLTASESRSAGRASEVLSGSLGMTEGRSMTGVSESRLMLQGGAKKAGSNGVSEWQVLPDGPIQANVGSRRLPDNADKLPLADIHKSEPIAWEFANGKSQEWKINEDGVKIRLHAQQWSDAFMQGRYGDALRIAVEAPVNARVDLNPARRPHEVKISVEDLKKPEIVQMRMNELSTFAEFKWQQRVSNGLVDETKLEVVIPKPIIQLKDGPEVAFVDFVKTEQGGYKVVYPETTVKGADLTPAQIAEIRAIRQSPEGQRLLAETAIFGYEESIVHANQHITQGGRVTSPTFAEFAKEFASQSENLRGHRLAYLGALDTQHAARPTIFEQEVPALLYDAGMPLDVVHRHFFFGPRHVERRQSVMNFLYNRERILGNNP